VSEERFWELAAPLETDPAVRRSTMMGLRCLRHGERFFASFDRRTQSLLIKLDRQRVGELVDGGIGRPFAPAGRIFREWVAIPDTRQWPVLLQEARGYAASDAETPAAPGFAGFGAAGFAFLAELEHRNSKEFFDAHREVYRRELFEPSKAFVVALDHRVSARISSGLRAEPRVGGSLFRINHDRRFAPGKPPYKPYVDIIFWEGPPPARANPALILRLSATTVELGAGVSALTGARLDRYRTALADPELLSRLDRTVTDLTASGARLSEPTRTRVLRGWDPGGPAARFVVRDGFHLTRTLPRPAVSTTSRFADWCADHLDPFADLHRWLVDVLGER
jgi:uncharacterized protein (TIGR02453 family)